MWVTSDVDLPEALLEAQQDDRLVAFVGAGVSRNPPSGLPLFADLAKEVASDVAAPWDDEAGDHPDQFLGRLVDDKVDVLTQTEPVVHGMQPVIGSVASPRLVGRA